MGAIKMKLFRLSFVLLIFFGFSGCATLNRPTPEDEAKADYGKYPDDYKVTIQEYMKNVLKDPYSAVYSDWIGPTKGYIYDSSRVYYGYKVCVAINAKNSMGGYTGSKSYAFIVNPGWVLKSVGGYDSYTPRGDLVFDFCNSIRRDMRTSK
jgi:hypothetical protein